MTGNPVVCYRLSMKILYSCTLPVSHPDGWLLLNTGVNGPNHHQAAIVFDGVKWVFQTTHWSHVGLSEVDVLLAFQRFLEDDELWPI